MKRLLATMILVIGLAQVSVVIGQDVVVNGRPVSRQEIKRLQQSLGIKGNVTIPPGRYWYDPVSGIWGIEGGPTEGQIYPGLKLGGPLRSNASNGNTGVFINGRQIHYLEYAWLKKIFGVVYQGRYWMNARGVGGYEGGPALFDLSTAMASSRSQDGMYGGYTRRTPFGGIGGDSNCFYYMHPGGSSVMTCD